VQGFSSLLLKHEYIPSQFGLGTVIPLLKHRNGNLVHFLTHDLQLGFKKNVACGPDIFIVQQLVKCFTSRSSAIRIAALDASKVLHRVKSWCFVEQA
jgi:hypothetical protein